MKEIKNKPKIIIICTIVVIICIALIWWIVSNIEENNKENSTNNEKQEIIDIPEKIEIKDAINNGWFVIDTKNEKIYNKNVLDRFIENTNINTNNRIEDKITIAQYNINQELTIYELEYKRFEETYINANKEKVNKTGYILKIDPSRVFSYENSMNYEEQIEAHKVKIIDDIPGQFYGITLTQKPEFEVSIISLSVYTQIEYASEVKTYEEIEIARFLINSEIINNPIGE